MVVGYGPMNGREDHRPCALALLPPCQKRHGSWRAWAHLGAAHARPWLPWELSRDGAWGKREAALASVVRLQAALPSDPWVPPSAPEPRGCPGGEAPGPRTRTSSGRGKRTPALTARSCPGAGADLGVWLLEASGSRQAGPSGSPDRGCPGERVPPSGTDWLDRGGPGAGSTTSGSPEVSSCRPPGVAVAPRKGPGPAPGASGSLDAPASRLLLGPKAGYVEPEGTRLRSPEPQEPECSPRWQRPESRHVGARGGQGPAFFPRQRAEGEDLGEGRVDIRGAILPSSGTRWPSRLPLEERLGVKWGVPGGTEGAAVQRCPVLLAGSPPWSFGDRLRSKRGIRTQTQRPLLAIALNTLMGRWNQVAQRVTRVSEDAWRGAGWWGGE